MSARRGDLERSTSDDLASHVGEVRAPIFAVVVDRGRGDLRPGTVASQCEHEICKILRTSNFAIMG
jgi:hypothetical protein